MPQTTNCDNSKRSAYIIAIDNGSNEWNCVFFSEKKWKMWHFMGQFPILTKLTMVTSNFIGWLTLGII